MAQQTPINFSPVLQHYHSQEIGSYFPSTPTIRQPQYENRENNTGSPSTNPFRAASSAGTASSLPPFPQPIHASYAAGPVGDHNVNRHGNKQLFASEETSFPQPLMSEKAAMSGGDQRAVGKPDYQNNQYQQRSQPISQQPITAPSMTPYIAGGNRNAKDKPVSVDGQREWSYGLCKCSEDCGTCCVACWCPCVSYAKNKHRREHLAVSGTPDPTHGGPTFASDCYLHALLQYTFGAGWIAQIATRGDTRTRYGIHGSGFDDCCASFWCSPCALTQESQEIELEEQSFRLQVNAFQVAGVSTN